MNKNIKNNLKQVYKIIGFVIAVVIVLFFVRSFIVNWNAIKGYLLSVDIRMFCVSLVIYAIVFFLTAWNWTTMIGELSGGVDKQKYVHFYLYSSMARYIPGGIWNIAGKLYLCEKDGNKREGTVLSIVFEYIFQIVSSIFFLMLMFRRGNQGDAFDIKWIIVIIAAVILFPILSKKILRPIMERKEKINNSVWDGVNFRFYIKYMIRYCGVWILTGIAIVFLVLSFLEVSKGQVFALILSYPVSWVIGFLSPTPNGIGTKEGMMIYFLQSHFDMEFLVMLTMIIRVWTMIGEILLVAIYEIYYFLKRKAIKNE